jgi:aromatic ring-opening dioxygenase catalytic subunit (LigB family)
VGLGEYGAVGDSLALGFGEASGFETRAVVGEPSCPHGRWPGVVNMVPAKHFKFLLISAGTNDVPGKCVEAIRAKANADQVMWVIPVNGARQHVLSVAHAHHDRTLSYTKSLKAVPMGPLAHSD